MRSLRDASIFDGSDGSKSSPRIVQGGLSATRRSGGGGGAGVRGTALRSDFASNISLSLRERDKNLKGTYRQTRSDAPLIKNTYM